MGDERWSAKWEDPDLVAEAEEVSAYDPVLIAQARITYARDLLQLLVAGKDSENPSLRDRRALHLRRAYLSVVGQWRSHEERHQRGLVVPDWRTLAEVPPLPDGKRVMSFSMARWEREDVPELEHIVAVHFAITEAVRSSGARRSEVKKLRSIGLSLGKELDYVRWATGEESR